MIYFSEWAPLLCSTTKKGSSLISLATHAIIADHRGLLVEKLDKIPDALTRVRQSGANNIQIIQKKKLKYFLRNRSGTVSTSIESCVIFFSFHPYHFGRLKWSCHWEIRRKLLDLAWYPILTVFFPRWRPETEPHSIVEPNTQTLRLGLRPRYKFYYV